MIILAGLNLSRTTSTNIAFMYSLVRNLGKVQRGTLIVRRECKFQGIKTVTTINIYNFCRRS